MWPGERRTWLGWNEISRILYPWRSIREYRPVNRLRPQSLIDAVRYANGKAIDSSKIFYDKKKKQEQRKNENNENRHLLEGHWKLFIFVWIKFSLHIIIVTCVTTPLAVRFTCLWNEFPIFFGAKSMQEARREVWEGDESMREYYFDVHPHTNHLRYNPTIEHENRNDVHAEANKKIYENADEYEKWFEREQPCFCLVLHLHRTSAP